MEGIRGHKFENWAKTFSSYPELYFEPQTVNDIRKILDAARTKSKTVKVVGNGHSPSNLPCTSGYMISMKKMNKVLSVDRQDGRIFVRVESGKFICDLNEDLYQYGAAIPVLGAVGDVTVGGVISTATHGSSVRWGTLSSLVVSMRLLTADGELVECSRQENADLFLAAACSFGSIGIIIDVTLECVPAHNLRSRSYGTSIEEAMTLSATKQAEYAHFKFFWYPHADRVMVVQHQETKEPTKKQSSWFWNYLIGYYLLELLLFISTFASWLVPVINRFYYRLLFASPRESIDRHDKQLQFECLFRQYVSEWSIPRDQAGNAINRLNKWIRENNFRAHFPVEVRFVPKDDIWLSPAYGCDRCYINIICYRPYGKLVPHQDYFAAYENIMFSLGGRPHWAKRHRLKAKDLKLVYPKWADFQNVRKAYDPNGMFMNTCLQEVFN